MSVVTNVILKTSLHDKAAAGFIKRVTNLTDGGVLEKVDQHAGGSKVMELDIYMAAFNNLDMAELRAIFFQTPWTFLDSVQLFVQEQEEERMKVLWMNEHPAKNLCTDFRYYPGESESATQH